MSFSFFVAAGFTVAGALAAMVLRNLIHCVLALVVGFAGLAAVYLQLGAQFVGLAQIFVYAGAVAILAAFVILLTQGVEHRTRPAAAMDWAVGALLACGVFAVLAWAVVRGVTHLPIAAPPSDAGVHAIGDAMLHRFVLPLEVAGLLLTVALIGAVLLAMRDGEAGA
jgi:NADH-quinone oxidoreductase subunit J